MKTIDRLLGEDKPSTESIIDTLAEYVSRGAAIGHYAVVSLLEAASVSTEQMRQMRDLCIIGHDNQYGRGHYKDAAEWLLVLHWMQCQELRRAMR